MHGIPAGADDYAILILGMNLVFHLNPPCVENATPAYPIRPGVGVVIGSYCLKILRYF